MVTVHANARALDPDERYHAIWKMPRLMDATGIVRERKNVVGFFQKPFHRKIFATVLRRGTRGRRIPMGGVGFDAFDGRMIK